MSVFKNKIFGIISFIVVYAVVSATTKAYFAGDIDWFDFRSPEERVEARVLDAANENTAISEYYRDLKALFPDQYDLTIKEMVKIEGEGMSNQEVFQHMAAFSSEFRRANARLVRFSSQETQVRMLQSSVDVLKHFSSDFELCNQIALSGPAAIPVQRAVEVLPKINGSIFLRAIYEGKNSPIQRPVATDSDFEVFVPSFLALNPTDEEIRALSESDVESPALCSATIKFIESAINSEYASRDVVIAELVAEINKY